MSRANHFRAFIQALEQDLELAVEMDRTLRRAQTLNIDFRDKARQRLLPQAELLIYNLGLRNLVLFDRAIAVNNCDAFSAISPLISRAHMDTMDFAQALTKAAFLDPEKEPELDALIAVRWLLAESITVAATLVEVPTRPAALPASQLIARLGARLLPWEERQRYLDEYLSELDELAQDSSRRAQLAHALRLLVRAPALRMALRQSRLYAYRETR